MTRHDLKEQLQHDQFTDTVSGVVSYTQTHRQQVIRWSAIAVVVLLVAGGIWAFLNYQKSQRQKDLSAALSISNAQVGPPNDFTKTYPSEDAKNTAAIKALSEVAAKHPGTNEGMIALYDLATMKAKKDQLGAESDLKQVADSSSDVTSLAKIALAQIYVGENKVSQAQSLLRSLVDHPTDLVSKAQAQILLAQLEATTDPKDAQAELKAIAPDAEKRAAVSRAVDAVSSKVK